MASVVKVEHAKPIVKTITLKLEAYEADDVKYAMVKYYGNGHSIVKAITEAQLGKVDVNGFQFSLPPMVRPF